MAGVGGTVLREPPEWRPGSRRQGGGAVATAEEAAKKKDGRRRVKAATGKGVLCPVIPARMARTAGLGLGVGDRARGLSTLD